MNLSDDPDTYAKQWFFITLVGFILFSLVVGVFVL